MTYKVDTINIKLKGNRRNKRYYVFWKILVFKEEDSYDILVSRDINEDLHDLIREE